MKRNFCVLKAILSVILCFTLMVSYFPETKFEVFAEENGTNSVIQEVTTEAEFMNALANTTVDVIQLKNEISIPRSQDGKDNAFVIDRSVTIRGNVYPKACPLGIMVTLCTGSEW